MEKYAETHFRLNSRKTTEEKETILRARGVKNFTIKPTETTKIVHRNSQSLNPQPRSLYGTNPGI